MRICSLLPGATEIVFALGMGDEITGVTHECDYPPEAKEKLVVVRSNIDPKRMTSGEIDRAVGAILQGGNNLYRIDHTALAQAAPHLILTQSLCDVCALDYNQVVKAADALAHKPEIIALNPHSLADVLSDILRVGVATGRLLVAEALVCDLQARIDGVAAQPPDNRPRVVCLEWFEPLYVAGHWMPEIVSLAGGEDVLARAGEPSRRVEWQDVLAARPDMIFLMPCGFDVRRTAREATPLRTLQGWNDLPAVKSSNVYALNGNAYFSRPGPRLVNGLEILAQLIHPGRVSELPSPTDVATLN